MEEETKPVIVMGSVREMSNGEFLANDQPETIKQELVETPQEPTPVPECDVTELEGGEAQVVEVNNRCNCTVEELLGEPYQARDFSRTLEIIEKGRPTPNINISSSCWKGSNGTGSTAKRFFKDHYYEKVEWLTGCDVLGKLYCWPCLLFDKMPSLWNKAGFEDVFNFHKAFKRHENTQNHIVAAMQLVAFVMNHCRGRVREDADEKNTTVKANREALKRLIEAVGAVGGASPTGIEAKQLMRLARRDIPPFRTVPDLHLAILSSTSRAFTESLADMIQDSPFVSLFLDESADGSIITVLRYTTAKGELTDTFAGFMEGDDLAAVVARVHVLYSLNGKLVAILLGALSRAETLPRDSKAILLHSPAHRMSQVVPRALQHLKECAAFFHVVHCFENWLKDPHLGEEIKARVPNSNVSKWKERPVTVLHEHREIIQDLVHSVLEKPSAWHPSSYTSALALQHALKDLEFTFLLRVFKELLPVTDALLDMVINNAPNVKVCSDTVDDYVKVLNWKKEKFDEIWESVQEVDLDGPAVKKPRHVGTSRIVAYYRTLYETIVDAVVRQVKMRFDALRFLEFASLLDIKEPDRVVVSEKQMVLLRGKRDDFESARLRNELLVAYAQVDFRGLGCEQLLRHLYDTGLSGPLRQVTRLARLLLMLPYASKTQNDSTNRLFTKIHTFSRQAAQDPELLPWASITLENQLLNKRTLSDPFLDNVIDIFADSNPNVELTPFKPKTL